ncbi:hypothetical protein HZS_2181 [Henneguya salminicola]|uniref:40S ribosomal protein S15 n=1 Tax=Henneguya salminicola TaxID=69463 RepID=A0A6G3MLD0_HENSL|nr:hypothetical protein HZS_2181 [Henneguya salminicola]
MSEEKQHKRTFRKYFFRGIDLEKLLDMHTDKFMQICSSRVRRRYRRGLKDSCKRFLAKLRKAKRGINVGEKPPVVKTHLRNMIVVPEMVGSMVGVHFGKGFTQVEIKPDMIGHYLGEFALTYRPVRHGRPGFGATHSSRFIPLK